MLDDVAGLAEPGKTDLRFSPLRAGLGEPGDNEGRARRPYSGGLKSSSIR